MTQRTSRNRISNL